MTTAAATSTPPLAYNARQAAAEVGLSKDTIENAIRSGALKAKRSGKTNADGRQTGRYLIAHRDLVDWFNSLEDAR